MSDNLTVEEAVLLDRITKVTELLDSIHSTYLALQPVGARSSYSAWTAVPSCQGFATSYLGVVNATVGILQQAHDKVTGLVEGLRGFADEIGLADGDAKDAMEALERSAALDLPAPGVPVPPADRGGPRIPTAV